MVHVPEKRGLSSQPDPVNVSRERQDHQDLGHMVRPWWFVVGLMDEVRCGYLEPA